MPTITDNAASPALLASMNPSKATKGVGSADATQDRFMKLLVTQMKNQDPLNPMDNAQVTSQLAQLSTVSGIDKLNATMASMQVTFQAGQTMQATGLIGHGVLVPGNNMALTGGKGVMGIDLPSTADKVSVTIRDASGRAMQKIDLGPQVPGSLPLAWDGKTDSGAIAPDGQYTFEITASNVGVKVDATTLTFAKVGSVSTGAAGTKLNLTTGATAAISDVREIL